MVTNDHQLILDFVNTLDLRPYEEGLDSPQALREWLAGQGLLEPDARVTSADLEETIRVREALRDLLAAQNELPVDVPKAGVELDDAICRAKLALRFVDCDMRLVPGVGGVRGAVGKILADVSEAMADGTWDRMKACRAEDCRWVFLDTAKNRSRAWCSMSSCGNRAKVNAYRARHAH
ncbi:MAG TPA: CGNR zinc finger domain-containing protein [Gaiellaceae bacterium]|nr:CGNR zinc finger domain-containing protein [Gaiellaceae bacterium]